jgi:hypothetical protein
MMHKLKVILSLAGLALSSCALGAFDDLEKEAWVHTDGPGAVEGGFGFAIIPAGSTRADLRYFVAANLDPVFLPVTVNQAGKRSAGTVSFIRELGDDNAKLGDRAVFATDEEGYTSPEGNVAIGYVDAGGAANLFMLRGEEGGAVGRFILSDGSGAPTGVAFGTSNSDADTAVDLFALAGNELNILPNYQALDRGTPAGSCALAESGGALVLADVDAGADGEEVIFAAGGQVSATTGQAITAAIGAQCQAPLGTIAAPGGEASFGQLIAKGNFDEDEGGPIDLVIAAPDEEAVYVVLNWDGLSATPTTIKIANPGASKGFGKSIAVGDFDGDNRDELAVAAPQSDIAAHPEAGKVFIYGSDLTSAPHTLHDARAQDKQVFGQSLAVAQAFDKDTLIVGANDEVFTYYQVIPGGHDIRE